MEAIAGEPLPHCITYPQTIRSAKDKKTYKYSLLKNNPETLMADVSLKGDRAIITNLLLYTTDCNLWHTVICKHYKSYRKLGICNGRQIQIYEENDTNRAFLTVNIYHNGTIMFQGTEACLSSVQANFTILKALAEAEKQAQGANSDAAGGCDPQSSRERLEEMELNPDEHNPQLEQSVSQIRNSLSLQEVELVELRELTLSHAVSSERLQHLENKLNHLTRDFETSVEELKREVCKLQQDRNALNKELETVRQELLLREGEIQSLREQTESLSRICKQRPSSPSTQTAAAHTPTPESSTPTAPQAEAPEGPQEQGSHPQKAEVIILIDSNGKFINEKQLFPGHKTLKLWCPKTDIALQQLNKENLGEPSHIIIHVGTNDLRAQQERVADSVTRVAMKATQTFPTSRVVISTILPRSDFHPRTIQRVNADISRRCAGMPNVHLAHHPTLDLGHLYDHVHLRKDSVCVFAKTLKDAALGRTPGSPPKSARATTALQPVRRFPPAAPQNIISPGSAKQYCTNPTTMTPPHRPGPVPRPQPRPGPGPVPGPQPSQPALYYHQPTPQQLRPQQYLAPQGPLSWDQHQHNHKRPRAAPARNDIISAEQQPGPHPHPHRPEQQEQRSYAAALKEPNHTNLLEIKDLLRLIYTRLEQ